MTREQYNEWRNHPATLFFRKFLKDRREALIRDATEAWLNDAPSFTKDNQVERGRIAELFVMEDIAFEVIEAFYRQQESEDGRGIETEDIVDTQG